MCDCTLGGDTASLSQPSLARHLVNGASSALTRKQMARKLTRDSSKLHSRPVIQPNKLLFHSHPAIVQSSQAGTHNEINLMLSAPSKARVWCSHHHSATSADDEQLPHPSLVDFACCVSTPMFRPKHGIIRILFIPVCWPHPLSLRQHCLLLE